MNNNLTLSSSQRLGRVYLLASLNLVATMTFAQTPVPAIKGTKTDNNYANTTEVSKVKGSSDAQVLAEIEGDYGIGDVVRIVITTPKPVTDPLGGSTNRTPSGIKITPPNIQITPPIGNRPSPDQETTPPQYNLENEQPNGSLPTPVTATPNGNRTPQATTPPPYNQPNSQMTPIANRPVPQQATKQPAFEYYNSKGERIAPPNPDGTFPNGKMTPIANRPAPQQATKPPVFEYYNSKGERIAPPTPPILPNENRANPSAPIANRPAPQQSTKPPVFEYYNSKGERIQPPTPPTLPNENRANPSAPIANRPAPQQSTKPPVFEYYNSKGERIPPPNVNKPNPNAQTPPIANRPVPQQATTPPQYNTPNTRNNTPIGQPTGTTPNNPIVQTNTPIVESKNPFSNTTITASTSDKLDLTNVTQKEDGGRTETTTNSSIRTPRERIEREDKQERAVSPSSGRVASGGRSSRASKSSGFSFKDIFSGMGGTGLKETKRRNMKSHRKYGCYRFN